MLDIAKISQIGIRKESQEDSAEVGSTIQRTTPFTKDQLTEAWQKYASQFQTERPSFYAGLSHQSPTLGENNMIVFKTLNKVQSNEIDQQKTEMMQFIRNQLQNDLVDLSIEVEESDNENARPVSSSDKMKWMIEQNPAILDLKRELGLELM